MLNWLGGLKCPECSGIITEDQKYCPHCGTDLDAPVQRSQEDALEYFDRAQKTYDRNGSMDDALLDCELAIQYNPDFAEAHNLHGLILDAQGKTTEAIGYYRKALELNPNLEEAKANLRDARAEQTQPEHIEEQTPDHQPKAYNIQWILKPALRLILVLLLCGGVASFADGVIQYLAPKSTVVFEADHSLVTSVKKADLEATAAILTERSQQLGYKKISFHVSLQNEIVGEIPAALNPQKVADEIKTIGLLEFVDFGSEPQNTGVVIHTDLNDKYFPASQEPRFHTIMSNEGIEAAVVTEGLIAKSYVISFVLTDEGSEIFTKFTSSHRGTYLGIVLDTIVISTPMINEPITGGEGSISGDFTEEEAIHLAAILQTKPLPIPIKIKRISTN